VLRRVRRPIARHEPGWLWLVVPLVGSPPGPLVFTQVRERVGRTPLAPELQEGWSKQV
jgi:hypothetical protein